MNIVVTGATSFIGAPMVDKLIGMGHDVYAVVRPASKNIARLDTGRERLHVIEMNLEEAAPGRRNFGAVRGIFSFWLGRRRQ